MLIDTCNAQPHRTIISTIPEVTSFSKRNGGDSRNQMHHKEERKDVAEKERRSFRPDPNTRGPKFNQHKRWWAPPVGSTDNRTKPYRLLICMNLSLSLFPALSPARKATECS
uniref:Uncharacterized protein n=1 Tax=Anopheles albimanus TaxID=7167 RepID=A0A182FXT1_ANOAL